MRAGLPCQQGLLARADPAGRLGRRRRLHRQDQVDRAGLVDPMGLADRLGLRPRTRWTGWSGRPLWSLRAFKAAGHREAQHKCDDGDRKTHRDSSSARTQFAPEILALGESRRRPGGTLAEKPPLGIVARPRPLLERKSPCQQRV